MTRLAVDPISCTGHGLCAELLPERISLDEWGYPLIAGGELPPDLFRTARRVAAACPVRALHLRDDIPSVRRDQPATPR
jgi:ferredoxin